MLPAKLFLVACLIAIAVSSVVDQSETRRKPAHHVTHHSTHHRRTSTENVKHENPPLDGVAHHPLHHKNEPSNPPHMESKHHENTTSPASPITRSHVPPQTEVTRHLTHNTTAPIVTSSKQPGLDNDELETVTLTSAQHAIKSTTDSPITQLDVPREEEVTHPFTHHTTDPTDQKADFDIPSLSTNEQRSLQHKHMAPNASHGTTKANPPQEHGKHHFTHHQEDLPVNATQDNVDDKLPLESVNHNSGNTNQETTTAAPTMKSQHQGREANAHHSVHPYDDAAKASPNIASDTPSEKTARNQPTNTEQEATTSSPIIKSNITTQEVDLPSRTESPTPASQNITTKQTPLNVQLEMSKITPLSESPNIQPNKSMQTGNEQIEESKVVPVGAQSPVEANGTQLVLVKVLSQSPANVETSAPPKVDSKDSPMKSSLTNMSDTNMTHDASEAESKLHIVKVKPPKSSEIRNPANGNRQRSILQEDIDERRTMAQARNPKPSDQSTRMIQNRRRMPNLRQRGNEEKSVSDEMKHSRERANKRPHNPHTSRLGRTPGNNQIKERNRATERQFMAGPNPVQGTMRMETLAKKGNTERNQMLAVPKRKSGNNPVKARVDGQEFIADQNGHVDTLRTRADKRRGSNIPEPRQTSGNKKLEGQIDEEPFLADKTRSTQGHMKMDSLDERENNRGDHTFTGARQTGGNKKSEERFSEKSFSADLTRPTQGNMKMTTLVEEHGDNKRETTFTGQRRNSGNNQAKGRVIDKEFVSDQENMKVDVSAGRSNRRNAQRMPGRKHTSGNEQVGQRDAGQRLMDNEMDHVEPTPVEERRGHKRTNRTSAVLRRSSGNVEVKTRVVPLQFETDAPGSRIIETAEIDNRRASRPSTGSRRTPGNKRDRGASYQAHPSGYEGNARSGVRRVNRKTQSHLRDGNSAVGGNSGALRRDHSRKKRHARTCIDMDCTELRANGKKESFRYLAQREVLRMKCAQCFETKGCTTRDLIACGAAGINFVAEEETDLFSVINLYGSIGLCVLVGLLIYVYFYQRTRKESNAFLCIGLIILCIFYIIAILAFVNSQKLFD